MGKFEPGDDVMSPATSGVFEVVWSGHPDSEGFDILIRNTGDRFFLARSINYTKTEPKFKVGATYKKIDGLERDGEVEVVAANDQHAIGWWQNDDGRHVTPWSALHTLVKDYKRI